MTQPARDIVLDVFVKATNRYIVVRFSTEQQALDYIAQRKDSHLVFDQEEGGGGEGFDYDANPRLYDVLHPSCPHGLALALCAGPQHYPYDADEMAYYGV